MSQLQFRFNPMNESYAHAIANWRYEGIYTFYYMDRDIEDLEELLDPHSWTGKYFAAFIDSRFDPLRVRPGTGDGGPG
jgi:hypothetical protein